MPTIPEGPLDPQQREQLHTALRSRLVRQVSIEVWTREPSALFTGERDMEAHGPATLALLRQLKTLHPALTLTPYDIDGNAAGAAERGVEHSPTVIMRCGGRTIRTVGLFFGPFFQAFLDELTYLSRGETPLAPETVELLHGIEEEVTIEAFLSAFDPISTRMIPLLGAFAVEGRRLRVTQIEASQFPVLASKRLVEKVPLLVINGQRFTGHYAEAQLAAQVLRVAEGSTEPVVRERVWATEYITEDQARAMAAEERARQAAPGATPGGAPAPGILDVPGVPGGQRPPEPPPPGSGLYIPGRR
jgi:hypothetical protein